MHTPKRYLVGALLTLVVPATTSSAQDALIVGGTYVSASRDPGQALGSAPAELQRPLAGGGRFAVGDADILDLRTGLSTPLPLGATVLTVDPVRSRVFLKRDCDAVRDVCAVIAWNFVTGTVVSLGTTSYSNGPSLGSNLPLAKYAVDADVLFVDQAHARYPPVPLAIRPVAASTGVPLRPALEVPRTSWDVLPNGSRLFMGAGGAHGAVVLDVATGNVTAWVTDGLYRVQWEPTLQALIGLNGFNTSMFAYDAHLGELGRVRITAGCSLGIQVSPHTGRIFVGYGGGGTYIGPNRNHMLTFAPETGQWSDIDIERKGGFQAGSCLTMTLLTAPGAPRNLRATVADRDVTLAWENLGAASHFVLDVGFAPGRTDASVFLGPDSHATFANVPSGIYYLRLRGGSEFGGGRPSQEIQVVVP